MRPITRKLRLFAALLGLAQGAVPALALAHELAGADVAAAPAHVEAEGTTHDVVAHSHGCGLCRNLLSKVACPPAAQAAIAAGPASGQRALQGRLLAARDGDGFPALPRGPPVG